MEKPKRERSEAQKKATESMLNKLKENREKGITKTGRKKKEVKNIVALEMPDSESEEEQEQEEVVAAPVKKKVVVKEVVKEVQQPQSNYLTKEDLHAFKNEIASLINPPNAVVQERSVKKPKKVRTYTEEEEEEYEPEPAPVRQSKPVVKQQPVPQQLTGYSLLDKLLNR